MSGYVSFNCEYNVLICKVHQHAIPSRYITRHFLEEHDVSLSIRQGIQEYASQYTIAEGTELSYPTRRIQPIPYLKIINGFQCRYEVCGKIMGTLESMKRHCRLTHDWKSKDGEKWIQTQAQTFYQGNSQRYCSLVQGINYSYFAVHEPGTVPVLNFTDQLLENLLGEARERDTKHQREINTVQDNTSLVTKTPWLRYTRWDKKFTGQDMNELHALTDPNY